MNPISTRLKVSDIAPTTLRLQPDVRDHLAREASMNNRSLSQEINKRLEQSLRWPDRQQAAPSEAREAETRAYPALADEQRLLLARYAALAPDKQLALLTLLKA